MIKILIYEYVTGGGLINEDLSSSLLNEAKLMTSRLYSDFEQSEHISFKFFLDERLKNYTTSHSILINKDNANEMYNSDVLKKFDYVLPILPETNRILYNYVKFLERENIKKLISDKQTVLSLSNKLSFYKLFAKHKFNVIPTYDIKELSKINKLKNLVVKDKFGAGCSYIRIFDNPKEADFTVYNKNYIVQPYILGEPYSISVFFTHNDFHLLTINKQTVKKTRQKFINLKTILVNDRTVSDSKIYLLLNKIKSILPKLYGYIGIDVIVTNEKMYIVEINPRLTTSYIGLNKTLDISLANLIIGQKIKKRIISGKKYFIKLNE